MLAIGQTAAELDAKGLDWGAVDVLLNCGVGKNAGKRDDVRVGAGTEAFGALRASRGGLARRGLRPTSRHPAPPARAAPRPVRSPAPPPLPACPPQEMWPRLTNLRWLHSASAGLEHLLFPELVDGPVVLTNAKGVYSHSLAE